MREEHEFGVGAASTHITEEHCITCLHKWLVIGCSIPAHDKDEHMSRKWLPRNLTEPVTLDQWQQAMDSGFFVGCEAELSDLSPVA